MDLAAPLNFSQSYTAADLKVSAKLVRDHMLGIPVKEQELTSHEARLDKYYQLTDLAEFMKSFFEASTKAEQIFANRVTLTKQAKRVNTNKPLEFSSDEELVYSAALEEEEDEDRGDLFKPRFDQNGQLLPPLADEGLTGQEIVQRFVASTKELFDRERGKSISKKVNLGDIIASQVQTSVILQKPIIQEGMETLIDRRST